MKPLIEIIDVTNEPNILQTMEWDNKLITPLTNKHYDTRNNTLHRNMR